MQTATATYIWRNLDTGEEEQRATRVEVRQNSFTAGRPLEWTKDGASLCTTTSCSRRLLSVVDDNGSVLFPQQNTKRLSVDATWVPSLGSVSLTFFNLGPLELSVDLPPTTARRLLVELEEAVKEASNCEGDVDELRVPALIPQSIIAELDASVVALERFAREF